MRTLRKLLAGVAAISMAIAGMVSSPALAAESTAPAQGGVVEDALQSAATGKWKVRTTFFGQSGEDIPFREGDLTFGYKHIQDRHPMNDVSLYGFIDITLEDGTYGRPQDDKVTVRYLTPSG